MLVLDEADRLMDLGFQKTLDAIIAQLPAKKRGTVVGGRQTLLFSATQTRKVDHLARLSLRDPEYLSAHADSATATPAGLKQALCVVSLADKTSVCWSFLRSHLKSRILVFLSSCKQVQFYYEAFRMLQPGIPLRCLHGNMSQARRLAAYEDFTRMPKEGTATSGLGMALFCTDVAARGLDFPRVQWVLQMDCPTDVDEYIHRVGRTARNRAKGRSLLCCTSEEFTPFHSDLVARKVPVELVKIKANKAESIAPALAALLSKRVTLKESAKKAVVSYLRSLYVHKNRRVFPMEMVQALDVSGFAASYGLAVAPKVTFLGVKGGDESGSARGRAKGPAMAAAATEEEEAFDDDERDEEEGVGKGDEDEDEDEDEEEVDADHGDDWLQVKRKGHDLDDAGAGEDFGLDDTEADTPAKRKKRKKLKMNALGASTKMMNQRVIFGDDDEARPLSEALFDRPESYQFDDGAAPSSDARKETAAAAAAHAERAKALLAQVDGEDKDRVKEARRLARLEKRAKFKASLGIGGGGGAVAMIGGGAEDDGAMDEDRDDGGHDDGGVHVEDRRAMRWKKNRIEL